MLTRIAFALSVAAAPAMAATPPPVCTPSVSTPVVVASWQERAHAGRKAEPPLTDTATGFAWPDTPLGVIKSGSTYTFFASDGADHARQVVGGQEVGNGRAGSITTTVGTLDDPLGVTKPHNMVTVAPRDVGVSPNPDPSVDPAYPSYTYIGGGPTYRVPAGQIGAGGLLTVVHAEIGHGNLYPALGLAVSRDDGLSWTYLGEIVRLNQAFAHGLDGFEIGDGPLVTSPDGRYFYVYFPDWIPDGTPHHNHTTNVSVARAPIRSVLAAAFGGQRHYAVPFQKFYDMSWTLQPGLGGASSDLIPDAPEIGYIDVHYNAALARYVMIVSDDAAFYYAESADGLVWSTPQHLGTYGGHPAIAAYPTAVGLGDDPGTLGSSFYVYYTHLPNDGTGWEHASVMRLSVSCASK